MMRRRLGWLRVASVCWVCLNVDVALAQKAPQLGYVYPPAVRAGATTDVQLGGFDFTTDLQWFVHDPQVTLQTLGPPGEYHLQPPPFWSGPRASIAALPIPREVPGRITVDPARPAGLVRWQVANANGASATSVLYVSHGVEVLESRFRDQPQRLPSLPVAVSGRLSRLTEVDRYEVVADRDGPISVELMSRRLNANFQGVLQVRNSAGTLLADFADTLGRDGGVTFQARSGQTYLVSLHDADFRGDRTYVYRLEVTAGPRVVATLPAFGQRGAAAEVEFVGWGVVTGAATLETVRQSVTFPADPDLVAFTHVLETPCGKAAVTIPLSNLVESADVAGRADEPLTAPLGVTGRFSTGGDERRFTWNCEKGEFWSIDLQSRGIGSSLDVACEILNADGKTVAENDDLTGLTDAGLVFMVPAAGTYTCVARCMSVQEKALDEVFRLQLERRPPGFTLTAPQVVHLPLGGRFDVPVQAVRHAGFDGEIALAVEGLPDGVTLDGLGVIPAGKNDAKITLLAAADAAVVAAPLRFRGSAQIGGSTVSVVASGMAAGNLCSTLPSEQRIETSLLAITMVPPFELELIDRTRQRDVHRGTTCLAEFDIVRQPGFSGAIELQMAAQQARYRRGIIGPSIMVAPETTRATYPSFMPEWLATDLTERMLVQGVAGVADPKGNVRYLVKPSSAAITMILEGALLKISSPLEEPVLRRGGALDVPIVLARSAKLPLATTVELVVPEELRGALQAEPLVVPADQLQGTLRITASTDGRLAGDWPLKLKATAWQEGKWRVASETELLVRFTE
ncbi:MAG: hypothetical protein SFV23_24545 [Planctomycetaceae bacterium]|nr:hypothetical protein [Planctomycetaceae bacterium]